MTEGFWDQVGLDEGGLPKHLPMGVTQRNEGPENDSEAHHYVCWCGDECCPLARGLQLAWEAGRRSTRSELGARLAGQRRESTPRRPSCVVEGCPGDGRYAPPGRGHLCTVDQYLAAISVDAEARHAD